MTSHINTRDLVDSARVFLVSFYSVSMFFG